MTLGRHKLHAAERAFQQQATSNASTARLLVGDAAAAYALAAAAAHRLRSALAFIITCMRQRFIYSLSTAGACRQAIRFYPSSPRILFGHGRREIADFRKEIIYAATRARADVF